jgi:hypothetical protein
MIRNKITIGLKLKMKSTIGQKGIAIYLVIMVLSIFLAIALGISTILVGQIKISREIKNSVVALYAADTGIENILYQEKLCRKQGCPVGSGSPCRSGCLGISDGTVFPGNLDNGAIYTATVEYIPGSPPVMIHFTSVGEYKGTKRAIETSILEPPPPEFTVWQSCQIGADDSNLVTMWSAGYKFTPQINITVTRLCGRWPVVLGWEERTVRLQNSSYNVLGSAQVTSNDGNWHCADIIIQPPYSADLLVGQTYYVSEYGQGYYAQKNAWLPGGSPPKICNNVSIDLTCYQPNASGGFTGGAGFQCPNSPFNKFMYGQADIIATLTP